jgi:hypothetical protein
MDIRMLVSSGDRGGESAKCRILQRSARLEAGLAQFSNALGQRG